MNLELILTVLQHLQVDGNREVEEINLCWRILSVNIYLGSALR